MNSTNINHTNQTIFIVDDDEAVRDSLNLLLQSVGLKTKTFESAPAFLDNFDAQCSGCLILDVRMPGMSGLDLAKSLREQSPNLLPIIFLTGHGDVPMAVEAMQLGALNFVQKPFRDQELLDLIFDALRQDAATRQTLDEHQAIRQRLSTLTPRETQVLEMILQGKANKVIAIDLGVSQRTVEIHRANLMEKMHADSLVELVRMVMKVHPE